MRTALVNEIRGLLSECGIVLRQGAAIVHNHLPSLVEDAENGLCLPMRALMRELYAELASCNERLHALDDQVRQPADSDEGARRIQQLDGVGPITASAWSAA